MSTMAGLRKIKFKLKHDFLTIDNVVLILAILLCLMWTYQSIAAMARNWTLSERLTSERKTLELLSIEVETNKLQNEYYTTEEYQELVARRVFDKQYPGEKMVVMPENSESAKNKHKNRSDVANEKQEYSNVEKWIRYLFPRY